MNINSFPNQATDIENIEGKSFVLDLKGFEGPLHLLLNLSRSQKVDLRKISLVDLSDQYLNFIAEATKLKIEIAADYLIMASWLVFLKSELLLPQEECAEGIDAEELAQKLKFQLLRLDAMRQAAVKLMSSDQLDRDFFRRGEEDIPVRTKEIEYTGSLLDMLQAYAGLKTKEHFKPLHLNRTFVLNPDDALKVINEKLNSFIEWTELEQFVPKLWREDPRRRRTAIATNFAVSLEQARLKRIEIMQVEMFGPLYLRKAEEF